jgi:hypothetical protein
MIERLAADGGGRGLRGPLRGPFVVPSWSFLVHLFGVPRSYRERTTNSEGSWSLSLQAPRPLPRP